METFQTLTYELSNELTNILNYWIKNTIDNKNGGFIGLIDGSNNKDYNAPKGSILNARILWTFSAAYRISPKMDYFKVANRAYNYLRTFFIDTINGGVFWELDCTGKPINTRKQIYAIAFAIYAFTEYYKISLDNRALELANGLFELIEKHSLDSNYNGYFEAFTKDWQKLDDVRLSDKDANENKTMNTHLHILEAYTNLYRVYKTSQLREAISNLISLFLEKFIDENGNLNLFFNDRWELKSSIISYGHDIECSWLLYEAAIILGDEKLIHRVKLISIKMAEVTQRGFDNACGLFYEFDKKNKHLDADKHWWPQAEAIVGYINAYQISGNIQFLKMAENSWAFIKENLLDNKHGEWYARIGTTGEIYHDDAKVGFWKCPYHNARACMEVMERSKKRL